MNNEYDLAIIGGGINGTAIARDAALRGLKVILLEKHDFAFGASSKNSKLAHGGLRYLKYLQFRLIKESLQERSILLKTAPNLVRPLSFIVPSYKSSPIPLWMLRLGLGIYDFLSPKGMKNHQNLSTQEIGSLIPALKKDTLLGGSLYYDAIMEDSRLVIENGLAAEDSGATLLNYSTVTDFLTKEGKIAGLIYEEGDTLEKKEIYAKTIVNATGAWSNQITHLNPGTTHVAVYPSKGVHLVLPQVTPEHALLLTAPQDGRVFFLIPWKEYSLLGTTDTPFNGDPDKVEVEPADIEYLLTAFNFYFPALNYTPSSIISQFAGLRPLVKNHVKETSLVSRDYALDISSSGLITLLGGKYTTYRLMAEKTVDAVLRQLNRPPVKCMTQEIPLCKFELSPDVVVTLSKECSLESRQITRLAQLYGKRSFEIFDQIKQFPEERRQICPEHPQLWAELSHAIRHEKVKTPEDWFERRTSIAYTSCGGIKCYKAVADKIALT